MKSYPKYSKTDWAYLNNILFNNVNNLAFLARNLTIDMKNVDNHALPELRSFQNNEILKFWASAFFLNTDSDTEK